MWSELYHKLDYIRFGGFKKRSVSKTNFLNPVTEKKPRKLKNLIYNNPPQCNLTFIN